MEKDLTPADKFRHIDMKWVWILVAAIVLVVGFGLTPFDVLRSLLENQGVGDEDASLIAFIGGYTLPLSVGFFIISFMVLTGQNRKYDGYQQLIGLGAILAVTGFCAKIFGLGLPPSYGTEFPSMPLYFSIPVYVITAYLNSYGISLVICALAIGVASALQVERWYYQVKNSN